MHIDRSDFRYVKQGQEFSVNQPAAIVLTRLVRYEFDSKEMNTRSSSNSKFCTFIQLTDSSSVARFANILRNPTRPIGKLNYSEFLWEQAK